MTRKELVRIAGLVSPHRRALAVIHLEMDRCRMSFAAAMSRYTWGPAPAIPKRKVSVPRSLRGMLGRYVEEIYYGGRKKKRRRRYNRRWMPETECWCE